MRAKRIRLRYWIALLAVMVIAAGLLYVFDTTPPAQNQNTGLPMETIRINDTSIQAEVASTAAQQELGLSNRTSLQDGRGMLFVFDPPKAVGFWMKDMHFGLDIVFAQADGTIVKVYTNVPPDSYPAVFPSGAPVRYVLEVPAGYVAEHSIAIGQKIVVE